jgi:hypothetical protein
MGIDVRLRNIRKHGFYLRFRVRVALAAMAASVLPGRQSRPHNSRADMNVIAALSNLLNFGASRGSFVIT